MPRNGSSSASSERPRSSVTRRRDKQPAEVPVDAVEVATLVELWVEHERDIADGRTGTEVDARSTQVEDLLDVILERTGPDEVWRRIGILVEQLPFDGSFGLMSAGILEDFVSKYGMAYIDRLEVAARRSQRWRMALQRVWGWSTGSIDPRLTARLEPYIGKGPY